MHIICLQDTRKGPFIATQLNSRLNSYDPVEQRSTNQREAGRVFVYDVMTYTKFVTVVHAANVSTTRRRVELSCVNLCRYKRALI